MKKILSSIALLSLLGACSGSKSESVDSDSIREEAVMEAVEAVVNSENVSYITADSIGPLVIGTHVNTLPAAIPGLYDHKEMGATADAVTTTFSNENGQQFIAYDFGEGNIDVMIVLGNDVKVNAPRGAFGLGDSFTKVLELPGVEPEWTVLDDDGSWYWKWEGLWFAPSPDNLPENLARRLYNSAQAPTYKDFPESVTIGYLATGLPF